MSKTIHVAVGPNAWGSGATRQRALSNLKRHIATYLRRGKIEVVVHQITGDNADDFHVSSIDGSVSYPKTCAVQSSKAWVNFNRRIER